MISRPLVEVYYYYSDRVVGCYCQVDAFDAYGLKRAVEHRLVRKKLAYIVRRTMRNSMDAFGSLMTKTCCFHLHLRSYCSQHYLTSMHFYGGDGAYHDADFYDGEMWKVRH